MSKKVVALIGTNPELKEVCERIDSRTQFMKKQLMNLQEKAEQIQKDTHAECEGDWDAIKEIVKSDLPKDYNDDKYNLHFSVKENAVYCEEHGNDMPDFLKAIFSKRD